MHPTHKLEGIVQSNKCGTESAMANVCIEIMLTMFFLMSSWNLNMTRERVGRGVLRQLGKASFAACTAALNSPGVVSGSRDTTS